jgi:adenylate kinase
MMAVNLHCVILGPPGAGKGTQAERLAVQWSVPKISTGDILRLAVADGFYSDWSVASKLNTGKLVSDEIVIEIIRKRFEDEDTQTGFVLDGFPRTIVQAEALDKLMAGLDSLKVVNLVVPHDELLRRLSYRRICGVCGALRGWEKEEIEKDSCLRCGGDLIRRKDDLQPVIIERLKVYEKRTQPLVDYYSGRTGFCEISGHQGADEVAEALEAALLSSSEVSTTVEVSKGDHSR